MEQRAKSSWQNNTGKYSQSGKVADNEITWRTKKEP